MACPTFSIKFGPLEEVTADMSFLPDPEKTRPCLYINKPEKRLVIKEAGSTHE